MMRRGLRTTGLSTLRAKLTLFATAIVAAVLLTSAIGLVTVQHRLMLRGVEEALAQRADNLESDVARGAFGTLLPSEGDREDSFLQLLAGDGHVLASSANIKSLPATTRTLPSGSNQVFRDVTEISLSSHQYRILARAVPTGGGAATLVVARNLDDVNGSVSILTTSLAISVPLILMLLAALLWWLTGRVLRPVESIRAEVASIRGSEQHRRVPVQGGDDEISRLARTMNAMLERVDHTTRGQRQFVADASHELRGPLTRIRSALEVAIAHPQASDPENTYANLLSDAVQLQRVVDDLLFLARSESGAMGAPDSIVDLDDLVFDQIRQVRARATVVVDGGAVSAARVSGDVHQLARAIANLADNAERHARTTITFELSEHGGVSVLVVADDGPGIPPEQRQTVFERFTRLDEPRSRDAGGAGLGLAIVADIVARHRGTITITSSASGGARFVMTLPTVD
ncbi:MAG: HAMP domain-containing histidine kinase [Actinomycetota bacterium]|nr:HAMP domain-containing histidine kinase [Actinomycetota bacterium]